MPAGGCSLATLLQVGLYGWIGTVGIGLLIGAVIGWWAHGEYTARNW